MTARAVSAARPLSPIGWLGLPLALSLAITLVFAIPVRVFSFRLPEPVFPLVPAFAWAVIRPSILPPFALLAMGLALDFYWGGPRGLWPLCLLTAYAAVLWGRRLILGQDFLIMWAWYAAALAVAFAVAFLVMAIRAGAAPNLVSVAWQYAATFALFPLARMLINRYEDADVRFR